MTEYVVFLRGVNSGRNPTMKMADLRRALERLGLENVRTVIASGNALFEAGGENETSLAKKLEQEFSKEFRFRIPAAVFSKKKIQALFDSNPFAGVSMSSTQNPYVTFLPPGKVAHPRYPIAGKGYELIGRDGRAVFSIVDRAGGTTPDLMKTLEKQFGKNITTRNWRTIQRVLAK